jgi:hypothetical protein
MLDAKFRTAVPNDASMWEPNIMIEAGVVQVFVGGGQPDFFEGTLTSNITISRSALWDSC